jgi:hypothetical protein
VRFGAPRAFPFGLRTSRHLDRTAMLHFRSTRRPVTRVHLLASLALLSLWGAACQSPKLPPREIGLVSRGIERVQPRDIVVLPLSNETGRTDLPLVEMRRAFYRGLVTRRYSPLALDYVDARIGGAAVPASYAPGQLDEGGVLRIALESWDDSRWDGRSRLTIGARVELVGENGAVLWGGQTLVEVDMILEEGAFPTESAKLRGATQRFAEKILLSLPARDPRTAAAGSGAPR